MSGEKSPAAEWLGQHGDALYRYALKHARDPDLAADLVQETLLAALQRHDSFKGRSSERTWLIAILRNKFIDHLRRTARETTFDSSPGNDSELDAMFDANGHWRRPPSNWSHPDEMLEDKEFQQVFSDCLAALPKRAANAFYLAEIEEMDGAGICKVLNVTSSNVWVMLHRARLRLRACLEANWFKEGT